MGSAASKDRLQTPVSIRDASPMSGILPPGRLNGEVQKKANAGDDMDEDRVPTSSKAVKLLSGHEGEVMSIRLFTEPALTTFEGVHVILESETT